MIDAHSKYLGQFIYLRELNISCSSIFFFAFYKLGECIGAKTAPRCSLAFGANKDNGETFSSTAIVNFPINIHNFSLLPKLS